MNKKAKLTLNSSIFALVLGVGAQFYTNYKIDQTLKQFPYHFKDHFIIQVTETNSDFFTRDLTFGIKYKDQTSQTDFIHTKLTALPFIISAESDIPTALIKNLNKTLNVTIDKNTISSQFSVFGENLRSNILTQFRDGTNTQQTLESDLIYSPKTGFMELQTNLSGLNYDQNAKIKGLSGEFLLKPVGESHYDMIKADVNINNIDIFILDGDNTRIELNKTNYRLNKYIDPTGFDLTTRFYSEAIGLSDKNTPSEQEKVKIEGAEISTKQLAVPSHVTFYDQLRDLTIENINLREIAQQLADSLFNNDLFEARFKVKDIRVPKAGKILFNLKNADLYLALNNKNKQDAEQQSKITAEELSFLKEAEQPINLKGIDWDLRVTRLNLLAHLDLLHKYLPEKWTGFQHPEKDNPDFLADLKKLAANYQTSTETKLTVKNAVLSTYFSTQNATFAYREEPDQDNFNSLVTIQADKVSSERNRVQFTRLNFDLPLGMTSAADVYPALLCSQPLYGLLCTANLSAGSHMKLENNIFTKSIAEIDAANVTVDIDTFPPTTKPQQVSGRLKLKTVPPQKTEEYFSLFQTLNQADINAELSMPTALIRDADEAKANDSAKLKADSPFWRLFNTTFAPDNPFVRLAATDNGQYEFSFVQKDGKRWLNGKDPESIEAPSVIPDGNHDAPPAADAAAEALQSVTETGKEPPPQATDSAPSNTNKTENTPKNAPAQSDVAEKTN